ncbi:MAG: response regulator [Bacteroidota bacterium]
MTKKSILVIEDQQDIRENIAELLELSNYSVTTAGDGKEGVKQAIETVPDLILCDIMMPQMDGYEVLYLLSKNPSTASIPFIFLTAKAEKSDFRKGMNMGADDYITKPFDEMELLGAIERRIARHQELAKSSELEDFVRSATKFKNIGELEKERKTREFRKKDIIYREGDFGSYVYKIKKGKVKTFRINEDGKELVLNILKEGDFMGVRSIIEGDLYTEFAEAMEETSLVLLPRNDFNELLFGNREVSSQFIKMLSQNLAEREHELMEMAYNTVRKRTADSLIKLYETYKTDGVTDVNFDISRADLASMVGTATESVIRILSEFKKDQWITINGSNISIAKPELLSKVKY